MKSKWVTATIDDVCTVVTDGAHNSPKSVEQGHYMASVKDFTEFGFDFSNCKQIGEEDYEKLRNQGCVPEKNDILVGKDGARYFEDIIIYKQDERPALLSSIAILRADCRKITPEFLYYTLKSPAVRKDVRDNYGSGSAIPRIVLKDFKRMPFSFPSIEKQRKITNLCSAIDAKIQINNAINENLQQQMQTLFADWLSANSEYATEMALGDICSKVTDGSHFSPKDDPTSSISMLSVKNMREFDFDLTSCKHICDDDYNKMVVNDCVPQVNDILVAKDGSYLKEIFICNEQRKLAILSSIAIFRPNTTVIHPEILLAFLKSPRVLQEVRDNYVSGSALPRIVLKDFKKLVLALPNMDTQKLIAPLFTSIREQIAINVAQNKYLTQLRDALLPKLMSGELNVDNIQL